MTGLPNRLLLKDRVNQAILTSKRKGTFCGILFIDLDRFKPINDTFGHEVGDKVLQIVAERLKKALREEDTISRIGGDEFVALIANLEKEKDVSSIAQKIVKILADSYVVNKHHLTCSASLGISFFPTGGNTFNELIRHADLAMYKAKKEGGSRFSFYIP